MSNFFRKTNLLIVFLFIPLTFGVLSLFIGRDVNWDLKNYHYYNAYSFLEGRMDFDIAPAQLQTYINPLGDLPFFWLTQNFPAWVSGFVLGFVHGFNLSLVLLIFLRIYKPTYNISEKLFVGILIVFVSGVAPGFISELGNTMNDNLTSLFVLLTLFLLIYNLEKIKGRDFDKSAYLCIGLAGFVMGFGVGIKPSIVIFAVSSAIVLSIVQVNWKHRITVFLLYGITGLVGGLLSAGFWWWELWQRFGNPFFPFYNHIFKSSYFTTVPVVWSTFIPKSFWEFIIWPFLFSADGYRVNQLQFYDIRFSLLYILSIVWIVTLLIQRVFKIDIRTEYLNDNFFEVRHSDFLLYFFFISYIFWIVESGTYRFIIPLEVLTPLCFLVILERCVSNIKLRSIVIIFALVTNFIYFKPFNWGRLDWTPSYFTVDSSLFVDKNEPIVIMLGGSPTSYIIPHFPPHYRFIRPEGNLFIGNSNNFLLDIKDLLKQHSGSFYILFDKNNRNIQVNESLIRLELDLKIQDCFLLVINTPDELMFCSLDSSE